MSDVELWRASLDVGPSTLQALEPLLSADERERAAKFRFERDRRRYVAGRGILRVLLGAATAAPPGELRFSYGAHGKPALAGGGPHFNLSHSGPVALYALSPDFEVGVDVELAPAATDVCRLAENFFSPGEVEALRSLPEERRDEAFLACWTRKEAFVKARGDGLSLALDAFDVSFGDARPCALTRTAWAPAEAAEWQLVDLSDPAAGYVAAIAARATGWRVVSRRYEFEHVNEQSKTLQEIS